MTDVLHAARASRHAAHLDLPGEFTADEGLLQQVPLVSKLQNNS